VLSSEIQLDDSYIGARGTGGKRGRGTTRAPFIAAVEKGRSGGCCLRATEDLTAASYRAFAHDHICKNSHIRTDGFGSISSGLASWPGLDPRVFDASEEETALRHVHNIISNFKSYVIGTYHGVQRAYLQSYMDEFSYRYCNRHNRSIFKTLIKDMCRAKVPRAQLVALFAVQPAERAA